MLQAHGSTKYRSREVRLLASHFSVFSNRKVTKRVPLLHPCPHKQRWGFPKIVMGYCIEWLHSVMALLLCRVVLMRRPGLSSLKNTSLYFCPSVETIFGKGWRSFVTRRVFHGGARPFSYVLFFLLLLFILCAFDFCPLHSSWWGSDFYGGFLRGCLSESAVWFVSSAAAIKIASEEGTFIFAVQNKSLCEAAALFWLLFCCCRQKSDSPAGEPLNIST